MLKTCLDRQWEILRIPLNRISSPPQNAPIGTAEPQVGQQLQRAQQVRDKCPRTSKGRFRAHAPLCPMCAPRSARNPAFQRSIPGSGQPVWVSVRRPAKRSRPAAGSSTWSHGTIRPTAKNPDPERRRCMGIYKVKDRRGRRRYVVSKYWPNGSGRLRK